MSLYSTELRIPSRAFTFDEDAWSGDTYLPPKVDYAEQAVQDLQHSIECQRELDEVSSALPGMERPDLIPQLQTQIAWWRGIASSDPTLEAAASQSALNSIKVLLIRMEEGSVQAGVLLRQITQTILTGLYALAANDNRQAAADWLGELSLSATHLNALLALKPNLLKEEVSTAYGIPGIISPSKEKTANNAMLVKHLNVGANALFNLPAETGGTSWLRLTTPINLWASRLIAYIATAKSDLHAFSKLSVASLQFVEFHIEPWLSKAALLTHFSKESWEHWFDLAWLIVTDITDGQPEKEATLRKLQSRPEMQLDKKGNPVTSKLTGQPLPTAPSTIRNSIKDELKKAFQRLAKD